MKKLSIICFCGTITNMITEIYCIITATYHDSLEAKANEGDSPQVYIW